jgi:RNA recognition motif-containing protein
MHGFVELQDSKYAQKAIDNLNDTKLLGRRMRVNWAYSTLPPRNKDSWVQLHVSFVTRELNYIVTEATLDSIFVGFGEIADICLKRHVRDHDTLVQSGYGFIYFFHPEGAVAASETIRKKLINGVTYDCSLSYRSEQDLKGKCNVGSSKGTKFESNINPPLFTSSTNESLKQCATQFQQQQHHQTSLYRSQHQFQPIIVPMYVSSATMNGPVLPMPLSPNHPNNPQNSNSQGSSSSGNINHVHPNNTFPGAVAVPPPMFSAGMFPPLSYVSSAPYPPMPLQLSASMSPVLLPQPILTQSAQNPQLHHSPPSPAIVPIMAGSPPSGLSQVFVHHRQLHQQQYFPVPYDVSYYSVQSTPNTSAAGMVQTVMINVSNGGHMSGSAHSRNFYYDNKYNNANNNYNNNVNNSNGYMSSNGIGSSPLSSSSSDSRSSSSLPPQLHNPVNQNQVSNFHGSNFAGNIGAQYDTQYQ